METADIVMRIDIDCVHAGLCEGNHDTLGLYRIESSGLRAHHVARLAPASRG